MRVTSVEETAQRCARSGPPGWSALGIALLAGCLLAPALRAEATPGASSAPEKNPIRVRLSVFIGSRELGAAPEIGSVYSFDQLADWLVQWEPGSDNAELEELFALRDLGEVVRQSGLLPATGGQLQSGFEAGGSSYEVRLDLRPAPAEPATFLATLEIRRDGVLFFSPKVRHRFGERVMTSTREPAERGRNGSFVFFVLEAERDGLPAGGRAAPAPAPSGPPYRVDGERVKAPRLLESPFPEYTPEAKEARLQGVVVLAATIDRTGRVTAVEVLKGLPLGLSEAAVEAVRGWRFAPATRDGEAVDVIYHLTVNFRLDPDPPRP